MDTCRLDELERRTYRTVIDDGLGDIVLGIFFVALGLGIATGLGWLGALAGAVAVPAWRGLRKTFVEARTGYVRLNRSRRAQLRRGPFIVATIAVLIPLGLVGVEGLLGREFGKIPGLVPVLVGVGIGIPVAAAGYLFEIRRLSVYAGLIWLALAVAYVGRIPYGWVIFAFGVVVMGSGLFYLASFMRRYPAKPNGVSADDY
ncbi:MAG TPA: hypothetical protein VFQ79_12310 [Bryobacteraceae bacterium]|nr:hypothetical protein [Bryobacteraceae bacterium]